jgi:chromate transporter
MTRKNWVEFILDVWRVTRVAFGGPEAHYGVFRKKFVDEKKYISDTQLNEWIALFSLVPGPTSTQTIMAIGYFVGGPFLALFTFIIWAFPAMAMLIAFAWLYPWLNDQPSLFVGFTYIPIFGVALLAYGAIRFSRNVLKTIDHVVLFGLVMVFAYFLSSFGFWISPILLLAGGVFYAGKHRQSWVEVQRKHDSIKWNQWLVGLFLLSIIGVEVVTSLVDNSHIVFFASFYRFGYSIIGGGQLVIPFMIEQLVEQLGVIDLGTLFTGYTVDQLIPGPLFSFASFVGSMVYLEQGWITILAGLLSGISLFLPGIILVYIVFPVWQRIQKQGFFEYFLKGIITSAAALIALTAFLQFIRLPLSLDVWGVFAVGLLLMLQKKVSIGWLVVLTVILGFIL